MTHRSGPNMSKPGPFGGDFLAQKTRKDDDEYVDVHVEEEEEAWGLGPGFSTLFQFHILRR